MKKWSFVALLLVGATILGATVLREPIAWAAQSVDANIIGPLDGQGNVKVHEQGTANVQLATSPRNPVDVREVSTPMIVPFQREGDPDHLSFAVPSGWSAVVEYVSGECLQGGSGNFMAGIDVQTTVDGHKVTHFVPSSYPQFTTGLGTRGATGELVRIYADGDTTILAQALGQGLCSVQISGHLER